MQAKGQSNMPKTGKIKVTSCANIDRSKSFPKLDDSGQANAYGNRRRESAEGFYSARSAFKLVGLDEDDDPTNEIAIAQKSGPPGIPWKSSRQQDPKLLGSP